MAQLPDFKNRSKLIPVIDNHKQVLTLIEKLEADLPVPVVLTDSLLTRLIESNINLPDGFEVKIDRVHYAGDEGGICCSISLPEDSDKVFLMSITHLRIDFSHPLSKEVEAYKKRRIKKLKKAGITPG